MNTPQEFAELLRGYRRVRDGGSKGAAALVTIISTRGSTFRRAGARMLVCADGSVVRGLSGGCPERDIVERARQVIASGAAQIVRYDRESGLDVMMEMGCGGELEVLIEPLDGGAAPDFFDAIQALFARRGCGWLVTAFALDGAALTRPWHAVIDGAGHPPGAALTAHAPGNRADAAFAADPIIHQALSDTIAAAAPAGTTRVHRLAAAAGPVDVLIERLTPPHATVLIGVNASSLALARIASQLGWQTTVVDDRSGPQAWPPLPAGFGLIHSAPAGITAAIRFDPQTSVVIMTHHLERDIAYLQALADAPVVYLGAIGSRERAQRMRESSGLSPPRLRVPAGLDIGSETPEEIAVAIAAEIVAVIAGRAGAPLSASVRAIH